MNKPTIDSRSSQRYGNNSSPTNSTDSAPIPLPRTHLHRTRSEVALEEANKLADWRENQMYHRLLTGMIRRSQEKGLDQNPKIIRSWRTWCRLRQVRYHRWTIQANIMKNGASSAVAPMRTKEQGTYMIRTVHRQNTCHQFRVELRHERLKFIKTAFSYSPFTYNLEGVTEGFLQGRRHI
eukprot:scaffold4863_cov149-Skeletonema_marinoi.AAC.6